jgi:UDP-4-amino-4,6-dideoxy-N-acetyl-beta-L-altrosamine N-acetyltransferase
LRPVVRADRDRIRQWRNSERVCAYMLTNHRITATEHRSWFKRVLSGELGKHFIFLYDQQPLGYVHFSPRDSVHHRSSWGFYIGEPSAPSGAGSAMGYLGLQWAFDQWRLHKLCSEAFAFNTSSIRFHQRLGFAQEGLLKSHAYKNGGFRDLVIFGLLNKAWAKKKKRIKLSLFGDLSHV